jgi:hypothetical protein
MVTHGGMRSVDDLGLNGEKENTGLKRMGEGRKLTHL